MNSSALQITSMIGSKFNILNWKKALMVVKEALVDPSIMP
jgi:hypothetical protein